MGSSESKSEPKRVGELPRVRALMALLAERRAWEAANPELAKAWNEALAEDAAWTEATSKALQAAVDGPGGPPRGLFRLGIPKQVLAALVAPGATAALTAAKAWWLSGKGTLLLLGGVGSGKTTAAAWALGKKLAGLGPQPSGTVWEPAMFVTAAELDGASGFRTDFREWLERMCHAGLLVIDDLGTERLGDGEQGAIQRVLTHRMGAGRRTVLTANLDWKAFGERYGERIADRIRESGVVMGSGDTSLRGKS